jgi:hypothetical protein
VHERAQTKRTPAMDSGEVSIPPPVHERLRSSGQALDATTREFMESRFGHDFSNVRLHTDASANESATTLRARAFAAGQHIAFGAGQYRPHTGEGRRLLAHELTHTLQQRVSPKLKDGLASSIENSEWTTFRTLKQNAPGPNIHVEPHGHSPVLQRQGLPDIDPITTPRIIVVSGGQTITVYGTFSPVVEAALADGWLSFLEMERLWKSGKHTGEGGDPHQMMEMLTQRALPPVKGITSAISGLSPSEKLTWEGTTGSQGVKVLGPVWREGGEGPRITRFEHYLNETPGFESHKAEAKKAGVNVHIFNLQSYLSAIDSEVTIAPDDKAMLRRLAFLHYVIRYPDPGDRSLVLPSPSAAQSSRYKKLWYRNLPDFVQLDKLAEAMGLPDHL